LREDAQKLREEKTKLEGMVDSHNELIMEFTDMYGYNRSDEDAEDEDEDDNDGGDTATPPIAAPPPAPAPPTAAPKVIAVNEEDPWRWFLRKRTLRGVWQMQNLGCRSPASST
jgi:hypothetical protein